MDNASIHHGEEVEELFERHGMSHRHNYQNSTKKMIYQDVRLVYLPPYSPDLNPIEEAFSKIKHYL